MDMNLMRFIERLMCRHKLQKVIGSTTEINLNLETVRTDVYRCLRCGKIEEVPTTIQPARKPDFMLQDDEPEIQF